MTPRTKIIGCRIALAVLALAIVISALRWAVGPPAPLQILTLPNGEQYRFAGVTYGTENVPPMLLARLTLWLPPELATIVRKRYGGYRAPISQMNLGEKYAEPRLFVWYQWAGTNPPPASTGTTFIPTARLADQDGTQSGVQGFPNFSSGVTWSYVEFPVVPRRSRALRCYFYPTGYGGEFLHPFGTLTFPNPVYGRFSQWKPEALPAVKLAGDLEVRLDDVVSGHPVSGATIVRPNGAPAPRYEPIRGGQSPIETGIDVSLRSAKGTNETWVLHAAELSDATGNVLRTGAGSLPPLPPLNRPPLPGWTGYCLSIWGTLWPDEAAWRLKLELKRASGFAPADLVTFKQVPVPPVGRTNTVPITNTVGGIQVVLKEFVRRPNITQNGFGLSTWASQVRVELPGKPKGVALDFVSMASDAGGAAETYGHSRLDFAYVLRVKSIPTNAQTMDFTWLLQRTRTVEFMVKPPNAK